MSPSRGRSAAAGRSAGGWWRRLRWACRLLVLAVLLLARPDAVLGAAEFDSEGQTTNKSEASALQVADTGAGSLYVSLLDGTVHAIEPSTGSIQWSFSSGAPLISGSRRFASVEDLERSDGHIFPGADGALYAYRQHRRLERLPLTVKELVDLGPSVTPDGALVYGELRTTVYELDADTGDLQQTHHSRSDLSTSIETDDDALVLRNKGRTVLIGRKDYTVRSIERSTGIEHWNLSFSQVAPITPQHGGMLAVAPRASESSSQHLVVDEHDQLHSIDVDTGWDTWSIEFMTPPVAYFMGNGQPQMLLAPDAIDQLGSVRMGLMEGQPYAMPSPEHAVISSKRALDDAPFFEVPDLNEHSTSLMPVSNNAQRQQWVCLVENYTQTDAPDTIHTPQTKLGLPRLPAASSDSLLLNALPAVGGEHLDHAKVLSTLGSLRSGIWALMGAAASLSVVYAWRLLKRRRSAVLQSPNSVTFPNKPAKRKKSKKASTAPVKPSLADNVQTPALAVKSFEDDAAAREVRTKLVNGGSGKLIVDNLPPGAIRVGRLVVGPKVLGYGSHGTVVYDGKLDGRTVAVKRLLGQFYETAQKEINTLIVTDEHPNIIRCYAMEEDSDFVYVALERCARNLTDLVTAACTRAPLPDVKSSSSSGETLEVVAPDGDGCGVPEWLDANQVPTTFNMQIMRDVVAGLAHLHALGVVHRDIKPHNVLISRQNRAKLSDMGISKRLVDEQSSFDTHGAAAAGSAGWMAPETLRDGRKTRAVDNFSLGCVLYFCMTGGHHPFGENRYERDANILRGRPDLWLIQHMPEAHDLVTRLLQPDPSLRLSAEEALLHPFFWPPEVRLAFLIDISDRVEGEDRVLNSTILAALESRAPVALGGPWDSFLDYDLLDNLGKYRKYNMQSVRDLLRVIRNKCHHYRELPPELQHSLGAIPEGYVSYFTKRFPRLLLEMFAFAKEQCSHEAPFHKYFSVLPGPS